MREEYFLDTLADRNICKKCGGVRNSYEFELYGGNALIVEQAGDSLSFILLYDGVKKRLSRPVMIEKDNKLTFHFERGLNIIIDL